MSEIVWYLSFSVWLISHGIVSSRSIHVVVSGKISFFFMAEDSTIAWKIPWAEEPGGLQSMGSRRVGHDWATSFTFHFYALEKEMATHSSVLAWRIPGTGEPGGLPSMGSHRVGDDWSDYSAAAAFHCKYMSHLFYSFFCWWALRLFPCLGCFK